MEIIISAHGANGSRNYFVHEGSNNQTFRGNLRELTNFMVKNYPKQAEMLAYSTDPKNTSASIRFGAIEPSEQFNVLESLIKAFNSKKNC